MINLISLVTFIYAILFVTNNFLMIVIVGLANILAIVLGQKPALEERWENIGLPGREAFLPLFSLIIVMMKGTIPLEFVQDVAEHKFPILTLILSFAVVSNGLAKCGFFQFAAYKAVEKCDGETSRLILYIFIISSILTLFTSNDVVILTLTPIIYSICVHARIKNGKLIFLAQFVAANTLSMGLMIGSPTNIIIAAIFDVGFLQYFFLMIVPALFSFVLTLIVIDYINRGAQSGVSSIVGVSWNWTYEKKYRVPARAPWSEFTKSMGRWISVFAIAILCLILATSFDASLYLVSSVIFILSALLQVFESVADETYVGRSPQKRIVEVADTLFHLPYGIIFFSITFFVFAQYLVDSPLMIEVARSLISFAKENSLLSGPVFVYISGFLVNLINDLPASALIGETLYSNFDSVADLSTTQRNTILQAVLIGLNIGCYVTPVGALAGLLWFSQMRKEKRRQSVRQDLSSYELEPDYLSVITPDRIDLIRYGVLVFTFVGTLLGLFVPFWSILVDFMVTPVDYFGKTNFSQVTTQVYWSLLAGTIIVLYLGRKTTTIIATQKVALSHLSEIFTILNKVAIWSYRHRVLYIAVLLVIIMLLTGSLLYWAESNSIMIYGVSKGKYSGDLNQVDLGTPISFATWFFVYVGSSYEQLHFPQSLLGQIIVGIVPLTAIAAVLYIARSTSEENLRNLRYFLGTGDIPNQRIIIVNHQSKYEKMVHLMLQKKSSFIVLLCRPGHIIRAKAFSKELLGDPALANRVLVVSIDLDPYATLKNLNFASASEVYFLSDIKAHTDVDNMKMLTRIDAWLNSQRVAAAEELKWFLKTNVNGEKSNGDFLGIPKLYFEASSERQLDRVKSTLSELTNYQTYCTSFDGIVVDQLFSDVFGDFDQLNSRFGFCSTGKAADKATSLFGEGYEPFKHFSLIPHKLGEKTQSAIGNVFSEHFLRGFQRGNSAKIHSVDTRVFLFDALEGICKARSIDIGIDSSLVGVVASLPNRSLTMTQANAVVSSQSITTSGVLELVRASKTKKEKEGYSSKRTLSKQTIFFFNYNPYADSFVRRLLRSALLDYVQAVIIVDKNVNIPDDISRSGYVTIKRRNTLDDAISILLPEKEGTNEPSLQKSSSDGNSGIKDGDSVIVFTDYEDEVKSNIEMIQFIEGLDYRLSNADMRGYGASQKKIFLAVECNNEETRFLFEHLSVDKIIDTSRLRVSFMEQYAELYHCFGQRMKDASFSGLLGEIKWGQFHPTIFNMKKALEFAEYFKPFVVRMADRFQILTKDGIETPVVGLAIKEIEEFLLKYSEPPLTFVSICKLTPLQYNYEEVGEFGCGPQIRSLEYDPDYIVEDHDCLIMISVL